MLEHCPSTEIMADTLSKLLEPQKFKALIVLFSMMVAYYDTM